MQKKLKMRTSCSMLWTLQWNLVFRKRSMNCVSGRATFVSPEGFFFVKLGNRTKVPLAVHWDTGFRWLRQTAENMLIRSQTARTQSERRHRYCHLLASLRTVDSSLTACVSWNAWFCKAAGVSRSHGRCFVVCSQRHTGLWHYSIEPIQWPLSRW